MEAAAGGISHPMCGSVGKAVFLNNDAFNRNEEGDTDVSI